MSDKLKKLSGTEYEILSERFQHYCDADEAVRKDIVKNGGDPEKILSGITSGVDRFYKLYESDMSSEDIQDELENKMENMDKRQQYFYLANLLTAMTHMCGRSLGEKNWEQMEEDHESILHAIDKGVLDMDSDTVQEDIDEMLDLITEQIQQASILIIKSPRYEELQQACMEQEIDKVKALAVNTREAAVNMAAALYTLHAEKKLSSLGKGNIKPEDFGVMAASSLEMDAAVKDAAANGSWSVAKDMIAKASKAAVTLLVASPVLAEGALFLWLLGILASFSNVVLLIGGAIVFINLKARMDQVKEQLQPLFRAGARIVDATLDKVHSVYSRVAAWTDVNVVPRVLPLWKQCSGFVMNRIIRPAAAWLLRAKNVVEEKTSAVFQKARDAARRLMQGTEEADMEVSEEEILEPAEEETEEEAEEETERETEEETERETEDRSEEEREQETEDRSEEQEEAACLAGE